MGTIEIKRNSEWANKFRTANVYLDGQFVGSISDGASLTIYAAPGRHELMARLDWCSSRTMAFGIDKNERKTVHLKGFKFGRLVLPAAIALIGLYVLLKYAFNLDLPVLLAISAAGLLYILYFITFGARDYLRLQDTR